MKRFLQNQAIVVQGRYHVTHTKNDECLPCERDTEPGVPSSELLAQVSCCSGIMTGTGYHSSECKEITAVEAPKPIKRYSPFPRRRSGEFKL